MKIRKQREIVIEFERVRLIRKKAKTNILPCRECRRETDFISLSEAASLFGASREQIFAFIKTNQSHFETGASGEIYVCLVSFLSAMKAQTNLSRIKMIS